MLERIFGKSKLDLGTAAQENKRRREFVNKRVFAVRTKQFKKRLSFEGYFAVRFNPSDKRVMVPIISLNFLFMRIKRIPRTF